MAITLQCPRCTHQQKIDDDQVGKAVPCKICHHLIKAGVEQEKPKPKPPAAEKQENIKSGSPSAPPVGKKSTPKRKEDSDGDDDRPVRRNRRPQEESSSSMVMFLIGGGALVVLVLLCGGASLGGFFLLRSDRRQEDQIQIVQNDNFVPQVPNQNQRDDIPFRPGPGPGPQPFNNPNPFPPPPPPPPPPPQENLDPNNPNHIDRVLTLLAGNADVRPLAFVWLISANPDHPRRLEVAQHLEKIGNEELTRPFTKYFDAYFRWTTKDNVPSLLRFAQNTAFTVWDNDRRQKSMLALGKLKEGSAAETIAAKLGNVFDGDTATNSLVEMGPVAQEVVLKYFNHPDGRARDQARRLLQGYNAKPDVYYTQCLADLNGGDDKRYTGALQWLAQSQVDDKRKADVSKALNKCLDNPDCLRNTDLVTSLEKWGTTENVPKLAQLAEKSQFGNGPAIRILGKMRDPEGIKAIARSMANFFNQQEAKQVLRECGSMAEPAVIEAMNMTTDGRARTEYVRLLGDIGTIKGSGPALQQLAFRFQQDRFLILSIQQSQKAIVARGK